MYTIRGGPRTLLLETCSPEVTTAAFLSHPACLSHLPFSSDLKEKYDQLIGMAEERMTIVQLTTEMKPLLNFENRDFCSILLLDIETDALLIQLLEQKEAFAITKARTGPKLIVMKSIGETDLYFSALQKDTEAQPVPVREMYESVSAGTLILVTEQSLTKPIRLDQFLPTSLYTARPYSEVKKHLTINQLKYTNASLKNRDWYELTIKIYDSYGNYSRHYQRLIHVIDALDLGFVLGESWGTDAALAFMTVGVYNIKLLSFLKPGEIKEILLGLEYNEQGQRLVDYDLFYKKRKVTWSDHRPKHLKTREQVSLHYRDILIKRLTEKDLDRLLENDRDIEAERRSK